METYFLRASPTKEAIWLEEEEKLEPGVAEERERKKISTEESTTSRSTSDMSTPLNGTKGGKGSRPSSSKNKTSPTCSIF